MQNTYQFSTNNICLIFEEMLYKQNLTIFELQFYFHKSYRRGGIGIQCSVFCSLVCYHAYCNWFNKARVE